MSLQKAADKYLRHLERRGMSVGTMGHYRRQLDRFIAYLDERGQSVSSLRASHVSNYRRRLARDYEPATVKTAMAAVTCWVRYLQESGDLKARVVPETDGRGKAASQGGKATSQGGKATSRRGKASKTSGRRTTASRKTAGRAKGR